MAKIYPLLLLSIFLFTFKAYSLNKPLNDSIFIERVAIPLPITKTEFDSLIICDKPFYIPFSHPYVKEYLKNKFADSVTQKELDTIKIYPEWFFNYTCQFFIDSTLREEWNYISSDSTNLEYLDYYYKAFYDNGNLMISGSSLNKDAWKSYNLNGILKETIHYDKIKFPFENYISEGKKILLNVKPEFPVILNKVDTIKTYTIKSFKKFNGNRDYCNCTVNRKPITNERCQYLYNLRSPFWNVPNYVSDCGHKPCLVFVNYYNLDEELLFSTYQSKDDGPYFGSYTSYYSNGNIKTKGQYEMFDDYEDILNQFNYTEMIGKWKYYNRKGKLKKVVDFK
jgi:antitoxin component YwqK of YwqJK toxin-antitoxin module